jgi:hypothetical protein
MLTNISINLNDDVKNQVIQLLRQIEAMLPFLVNLSPTERQTLPKMGRKMMKFVESAYGYSSNHPTLSPRYLDTNSWKTSYDGARQLYEIMEVLEPVWEKVSDTYCAVGVNAYASARIFYKSLKAAENASLPGIDVIMRELGKNFVKTPSPETVQKRLVKAAEKKAEAAKKASAALINSNAPAVEETKPPEAA